jgi:hypothetical protein
MVKPSERFDQRVGRVRRRRSCLFGKSRRTRSIHKMKFLWEVKKDEKHPQDEISLDDIYGGDEV